MMHREGEGVSLEIPRAFARRPEPLPGASSPLGSGSFRHSIQPIWPNSVSLLV